MQALQDGAQTPKTAPARGPAFRRAPPGLGLAVAALVALPSALPAQGASLAVVTNRSFRPTAILEPHLRYVVAADSDDGRAIIRDLGIPPVAFAGSLRIEGIQPGARARETRPFPDTVRFEADGRVVLLLADGAGRPPITVEVIGRRGAAAGRVMITAPSLPPGRAILVTFAPADIYEMIWRRTGFGVRDRLRVDDRAGMAYLADSTGGPTTVAIGMGRGAHGRIQADLSTVVVTRDFGGQEGRERREVGAVTVALDPTRDQSGTARAEIVFGVGNSEAEAAEAARSASAETPTIPGPAQLRISTPSAEVNLLVRHLLQAAGWMLNWDVLGPDRSVPSSASRPAVRALDAWLGAMLALQRGDTAAVCGSYRLLRRASGSGATRVEVGPRLGERGRYLAASDSSEPTADAALVLLAHACYDATRADAFLRAEFPSVNAAARRAAGEAPGALSADALDRLAELDDELVRVSATAQTGGGDSLRADAERLAPTPPPPSPPALWRTIVTEAQRGISRDYGRLSAGGEEGGVSMAAAGTWFDLVTGELFGVTELLDRIEIAPAIDGIADAFTWQLDGWRLGGGDSLGFSYRPADRRAIIRLTATRRHRVVLRFPWLTAGSCVSLRRGRDIERPTPTAQADGSLYVDIRATFDPAELTVSAAGCAP